MAMDKTVQMSVLVYGHKLFYETAVGIKGLFDFFS